MSKGSKKDARVILCSFFKRLTCVQQYPVTLARLNPLPISDRPKAPCTLVKSAGQSDALVNWPQMKGTLVSGFIYKSLSFNSCEATDVLSTRSPCLFSFRHSILHGSAHTSD